MAENKVQHTPTPFKAECLGSEGYQIRPVFDRPLSELKADCGGLNDGFFDRVHPIATLEGEFFRQRANAEFIVKAVNNYDKLIDALKTIRAEGTRSLGVDGKQVREIYDIDKVDRIARWTLIELEQETPK